MMMMRDAVLFLQSTISRRQFGVHLVKIISNSFAVLAKAASSLAEWAAVEMQQCEVEISVGNFCTVAYIVVWGIPPSTCIFGVEVWRDSAERPQRHPFSSLASFALS